MKDLHEQDDNNLASFKKYVILTDRYRYQNDKNTLDYRPAVAVVPHYPLACLPPTCTHTHTGSLARTRTRRRTMNRTTERQSKKHRLQQSERQGKKQIDLWSATHCVAIG